MLEYKRLFSGVTQNKPQKRRLINLPTLKFSLSCHKAT